MEQLNQLRKVDWTNIKTHIFLFLPATLGLAASIACKLKNTGKNIETRPSNVVFSLSWLWIYISLGLVWNLLRPFNSYIIDILMLYNTFLLILWVILYGCLKRRKEAFYVLLKTYVISLGIFGYSWSHSDIAGALTTVYVGWMTYMLLLNYNEVNLEKHKHKK
tara:strand:- start:95 stop:583 length:489 start_codon:yes stop_codon:yes gene_type:complete